MASAADEDIASQIAEEDTQPRSRLLFSGLKLWFSRVVPQRDWLIHNAQEEGATVVPLEKQADILLVDHARKNQAPGTTSYRFVELSIRKGQLEDVQDHAVGAATRAARPVGSTTIATKAGRLPFTDTEDQFLWNMMKPFVDNGGSWGGNKIYEQIERINPRHPFQSWRHRWISKTQFQNRQITETLDPEAVAADSVQSKNLPKKTERQTVHNSNKAKAARPGTREPESRAQGRANPRKRSREDVEDRATLTPHKLETSQPKLSSQVSQSRNQDSRDRRTPPLIAAFASQYSADEQNSESRKKSALDKFSGRFPHGFTQHQANKLFDATGDLLAFSKTDPEAFNTGWKDLANSEEFPGFTAKQWRHFWESIILPKYHETHEKQVEDVLESGVIGRQREAKSQVIRTDDHRSDIKYREPETDDENGDSVEEEFDANESEQVEEVHAEDEEYEDDQQNDVEDQVSAPSSSPGAVTCSKCFTSESKKWRRDRNGDLLCNECGWFLKSSGVLRSSNTWTDVGDGREDDAEQEAAKAEQDRSTEPSRVHLKPLHSTLRPPLSLNVSTPSLVDAGVQTSPIIPSPEHKEGRETSPALEPGSPSLYRAPGPNEARKRSSGKGSQSTSQDTNKSDSQIKAADSQVVSKGIPREGREEQHHVQVKCRSPEPSDPGRSPRKRRRLEDAPNTLEIPNSPEHKSVEIGSLEVVNAQRSFTAPSPQPLKFIPVKLTESSSIFIPEDSDEEVEVYAVQKSSFSAPFQHRDLESSPLIVNLLGDEEQPNLQSSFSQYGNGNASEVDTASQYAFDTAPEGDVTQDWETAPEEAIDQKARMKARVETQVLFDITDEADGGGIGEEDHDEFALPEPEGGWEMIEKDYEYHEPDEDQHEAEEEDDDEDDEEDEETGEAQLEVDEAHNPPSIRDDPIPISNPTTKLRDKGKARAPSPSPSIKSDPEPSQESPLLNIAGNPIITFSLWFHHIQHLHPPSSLPSTVDLDKTAFAAIHATSFDFALATTVVALVLSSHDDLPSPSKILRETPEGVVLPEDVRGCFTKEDDGRIFSERKRDWEWVEGKHGREMVERRFDFLRAWERVGR